LPVATVGLVTHLPDGVDPPRHGPSELAWEADDPGLVVISLSNERSFMATSLGWLLSGNH